MTTTDPFTHPRPTWDEVMKPLADSPLWVHIRRAGSMLCEARLHQMNDYDSGISGSDVNHTVFGVASRVDRDAPPAQGGGYPQRVLTALVHEIADAS